MARVIVCSEEFYSSPPLHPMNRTMAQPRRTAPSAPSKPLILSASATPEAPPGDIAAFFARNISSGLQTVRHRV